MANEARSTRAGSRAGERQQAAKRGWARRLRAGGTEGNERLTVLTGILLIVLLAVLGITIVRIGQLLWLHLFLGLLLIGPVVLKLLSTGYRFVRYYTANPRYRVKGPPEPAMRLLAPLVVLLTVIVFATGVVLLLLGPSSRGTLLLLHKASFFGWIAVTAVHVLGHLPEVFRLLRISGDSRAQLIEARLPGRRRRAGAAEPMIADHLPGGTGRWLSLGSAMVIGLILALVLIPDYTAWTHAVASVGNDH